MSLLHIPEEPGLGVVLEEDAIAEQLDSGTRITTADQAPWTSSRS